MKNIALFVFIAVIYCFPTLAAGEKSNVQFAWFSSLYPEHSFWRQNWQLSHAAAEQLGVSLTPFYLNSDQVKYQRLLQEVSDNANFDGMVFVNLKKQDKAIVNLINKSQQYGVNHTIPMDYQTTGVPGQKGSRWIGEILVDEEQSGYDLAKRLIEEAIEKNTVGKDGKIRVFTINGSKTDSVGIRREKGFLKAINEYDNVVLQQRFNARHWSKEESYKFTRSALRRYPLTNVVISGNDDIALGVIEAAHELGIQPGKKVLTGGIDGTVELLEKIKQGEAVCTISGLFLHGAWSVVVLYDYLQGIDISENGSSTINVENTLIDNNNVSEYLTAFKQRNWQEIDFLKFSKAKHKDRKLYEFSLSTVVEQLTQAK